MSLNLKSIFATTHRQCVVRMNQSGLISSCETKMAEITRPGNLCCVCGEGSTDLVTTLNDLGPKFEKRRKGCEKDEIIGGVEGK